MECVQYLKSRFEFRTEFSIVFPLGSKSLSGRHSICHTLLSSQFRADIRIFDIIDPRVCLFFFRIVINLQFLVRFRGLVGLCHEALASRDFARF